MALSTAELAQMRTDQNGYMPDTCTILRATAANNAIGEPVLTWSTAAGTVACRLRPSGLSPDLMQASDQTQTLQNWTLTIAHGGTIYPGDRVVVGTATYTVLHSREEESWRTAVRADLRRLE